MTMHNPFHLWFERFRSLAPCVLVAVLLAAALLATACSGPTASAGGVPTSGSAAASAPGATGKYTISMTDANRFQPATLTVPKGSTVTWTNTGQSVHTITDDPAKAINKADAALPGGAQAWDSGNVAGGQSFSHTFDVPGTYKYFCLPHESLGMVATITVTS